MNTKEDIKYIEDCLAGKNNALLSFVAEKPGSVNELTTNVIMEILNDKNVRVVYCGPAIYLPKNVQIHYKEIYDKYLKGEAKFYPELEEYLTRGPIFGFVCESIDKNVDTIPLVKSNCGATGNPESGTMRNELFRRMNKPYSKNENGIHASGAANEAMREIANFMSSNLQYPKHLEQYNNLVKIVEDYQKDLEKQQ